MNNHTSKVTNGLKRSSKTNCTCPVVVACHYTIWKLATHSQLKQQFSNFDFAKISSIIMKCILNLLIHPIILGKINLFQVNAFLWCFFLQISICSKYHFDKSIYIYCSVDLSRYCWFWFIHLMLYFNLKT